MPTINVSLKDLSSLVGKKLNGEVKEILEYAKAELEKVDGDEISVKFNDTNLPYLWCAEGLATLFRGVLGKEKGIPEIKIENSDYRIVVDKSVRQVRPFIASLVAKGGKIDEFFLKQLIQLQEKFCENFGRRRQKVAVGIYPCKKIGFPVYYKAVPPKSVRFVPLEFSKEMTLAEILESHPKGKDYAWILADTKKYPLLIDSNQEVLSFPPVINSNNMGKLELDDNELFFEATGTDDSAVNLAACIFAMALSMRGFRICSVKVSYSGKTVVSPDVSSEKISLGKDDVSRILGIELKDSELKNLLEMARFDFRNGVVSVPCFRNDIMHPVDIVEDVCIMNGFGKIESLPLKTYTAGSTTHLQDCIDVLRGLAVGLGFQEVFSSVLTSREELLDRMNMKKAVDVVEVENPSSAGFGVLRSWLLPGLMDVLMKNKHVDFPQKVFEQGLVNVRVNDSVADEEHVAGACSHGGVSFTDAKQAVDALLRACGCEAVYDDFDHPSFIQGRVAKVIVKDKMLGFVGELHPFVLNAWGLDMPVSGFELNLSSLLKKE